MGHGGAVLVEYVALLTFPRLEERGLVVLLINVNFWHEDPILL